MKTISKQFQRVGNITLVQLETLEGEGLHFIPAASAIEKGGMEIREVRQEGAVNTLLAINLSDHHCLLTDMDLLKGAKQNRVVNTSVLLAPNSKREIRVSCVERSRWSYDSPDFKSAPSVMDSKMRAAKADSLRNDIKKKENMTQSKIWGLIDDKLTSHSLLSPTRDYNLLLESKANKQTAKHKFLPKDGFNGLAVFEGKKLVSFDIFGNRKAYQHYFDQLANDALNMVRMEDVPEPLDQAEAFYRLDEFLDAFESQLEVPSEPKQNTIGSLRWSSDSERHGFDLTFEGRAVHMAGFSR